MNTWMQWFSNPTQNARLTAAFLNVALTSFILLALVAGLCALWRRASAATRHSIWFLALASLALLPVLTVVQPVKHSALWTLSAGADGRRQVSLGLTFIPEKGSPITTALSSSSSPSAIEENGSNNKLEPGPSFTAHLGVTGLEWCLIIWGAGVLVILAFQAAGQIRLRQTRRQSRPARNVVWQSFLSEARETLELRRPVSLRQSPDNLMPMTWGWWRPVVLLPAEGDDWPLARQRLVLLHELAHVSRRDCLTQFLADAICAFYWFNPLVWLAARRMRVERERACDDLVLNGGCPASDYAGHLVDIAGHFRRAPQIAAVALARPSGLGQRVEAILDARRNRGGIARRTAALLALVLLSLGWLLGCQTTDGLSSAWTLKNSPVAAQLKQFVAEKEKQEASLIKTDEKENFYRWSASGSHNLILPNCQPFFDAASRADWPAVSNLWSALDAESNAIYVYPRGMWKSPVLETFGAVEAFTHGNGKYSELFGREVVQSIPPGSIYFGGTDPGRFIITLMQKSQIKGEPFFTMTQNALADGVYLYYLRSMYGDSLYIPTSSDSEKCFQDYVTGARVRMESHRLKPGEHIEIDQGRVIVSGQTAVMEINALLAKVIFDHNTNREFFIEQSWPLDWMYPHLEPHGFIFKINRQPLPELTAAIVERDDAYWQKFLPGMIGDWLHDDTSVQQVIAFDQKVFLQHDLDGFTGDPGFVQNDYTSRMFAKLRDSAAGLYAWRVEHAATDVERQRMTGAADHAYRQALALCPSLPEVTEHFAAFLKSQHRENDAQMVLNLAAQFKNQSSHSDE